MYLILADESLRFLPDAVAAGVEGYEFVFTDEDGRVVGRYPRHEVVTYGGELILLVHQRLKRRRRSSQSRYAELEVSLPA